MLITPLKMKNIPKLMIVLIFGLNSLYVYSQIDQPASENFKFRVKFIDEFFERFNFEEDAFIFEELKKQGLTTTRENMIISLFDQQQSWDTLQINQFISDLNNPQTRSTLELSDTNLFTVVNTTFNLKGKPIKIDLILQYQSNRGERACWTIIGIKSDTIFQPKPVAAVDTTINADSININTIIQLDGSFIRPTSQNVNFIDFVRVFKPRNNWENITPADSPIDRLSYFFALIDFRVLEFVQNNSITFHFLQIDNWIFEVDYFNRDESNSGWLISNLIKAKTADKKIYKRYLIYGNK